MPDSLAPSTIRNGHEHCYSAYRPPCSDTLRGFGRQPRPTMQPVPKFRHAIRMLIPR